MMNALVHVVVTVLLLFLTVAPTSIDALKHSFAVRKDTRLFMGPIGTPFGFLRGGCFGLDVFDFRLSLSEKWQSSSHLLSNNEVDAGLLLKRFHSESDFATYHEGIEMNASRCIFDPFRTTTAVVDERGGEGTTVVESDNEDDDPEGGHVDDDILSAGTDGIYIPLHQPPSEGSTTNSSSVMYRFRPGEEGLYFLMYQVCAKDGSELHAKIQSTFELDFHYRNYDFLGNANYLPAGETQLPHVFLYFAVSYAICLFVWMSNIRRIQSGSAEYLGGNHPTPGGGGGARPTIYPIHQLMSVLLILKTLSLLFESIRYHYIRISGHADLWSVIYYAVAFLKGTFLFTVILLIGSGWSFVKPFLSVREKRVICLVLTLQVVDNIALAVLSHEAEGERAYEGWNAILHLVDILCCCAVLVPIVWQVNALQQSLEGSGLLDDANDGNINDALPSTIDEMRTLSKLKLFRSFYLTVVAYIYFTRIVIYLFATMLDYRHTWIRYFIVELVTLLFYVVTGLRFRPMVENPYLNVVNKDESSRMNQEAETEEIEFGTVKDVDPSKGT